jgi:urease accessory protein
VVVLGLAAAFGVPMSAAACAVVVAVFALAHGHAHGTEMPATVAGITYGLGFVLATALLHVTGIALGHVSQSLHPERRILERSFGGVAAVIGVGLLAGLV